MQMITGAVLANWRPRRVNAYGSPFVEAMQAGLVGTVVAAASIS